MATDTVGVHSSERETPMLSALRSTVVVGLCLLAAVAASWIGGLDEPRPSNAPPAPPAGEVYRQSHCLSCPDDGLTPMKPVSNP